MPPSPRHVWRPLLALATGGALVLAAPSAPAQAAPLPAPYSAGAHGDIVNLSA